MVFNQSLLQSIFIFPENFKISKVTPINKGGEEMDPLVIDLSLHSQH